MSKKIDWDRTYKGAIRGSRGKYGSYQELLQKAQEQREANEQKQKAFKQLEPKLRKALLDRMIGKETITVLQPFNNVSEKLIQKSNSAGFSTVYEQIPAGTKLIYQGWDKTMGQWIFKSQSEGALNGTEVAIYDQPILILENGIAGPQQTVNTGFYGLLTHTDIFQEVLRKEAKDGE